MAMKSDDDIIVRGRSVRRFSATSISAMSDKPYKPMKIIDEKNIDTCLNCDKPKCSGNCEKIKGGKKK